MIGEGEPVLRVAGMTTPAEAAAFAAFREGRVTWLADEHGPIAAIVSRTMAEAGRAAAGGMEYTRAQIVDGTGFRPGTRFIEIGPPS